MLLLQHIWCLISIWRVNGTVWQAVYSPVSLHRFLCVGISPWMREEEGTDFKTLRPCLWRVCAQTCQFAAAYKYNLLSKMFLHGVQRHCAYILHLCFALLQLYKGAYTIHLSQRPFHKHQNDVWLKTVLKIKWVSFFYYCHFAPGLCLRLWFAHRLMHSGVSALFFTVLSIFVKGFSCLFLKLVSQLAIANSEKPGLIYGVVWGRL